MTDANVELVAEGVPLSGRKAALLFVFFWTFFSVVLVFQSRRLIKISDIYQELRSDVNWYSSAAIRMAHFFAQGAGMVSLLFGGTIATLILLLPLTRRQRIGMTYLPFILPVIILVLITGVYLPIFTIAAP